MKDIFELANARKSVRKFSEDEKVKQEDLDLILKNMLRMPNSRNLQVLTFVVVQDKELLAKLAVSCNNQAQIAEASAFIVLVGDYNKLIKGVQTQDPDFDPKLDSVEILPNLFVDAGIAASYIDLMATELGYGCTMIGGVFAGDSQETIKLLGLPKLTFPLLGITIGVPKSKKHYVKPRTDVENVIFYNQYDSDKAIEGVVKYNVTLDTWFKEAGFDMPTHFDVTKKFFKVIDEVRIFEDSMKKQGILEQEKK